MKFIFRSNNKVVWSTPVKSSGSKSEEIGEGTSGKKKQASLLSFFGGSSLDVCHQLCLWPYVDTLLMQKV